MDKSNKITVSAVVPVFEEEKTIAGVITALLSSPLLDEVIVVNDGSSDSSPEIIKSFEPRIKFINLRKNRGKGFALAKGIRKAQGEIVTFWDADNIGLGESHVRSLLEPILNGKADAVIGYRVNHGDFLSPFKELTGQRAYRRRDLIPHLNQIAHSRFGVEVYLNDVFRDRKTVRIGWKDLKSLQKYQKFDSQKAVQEYTKEGIEIAKTLTKQGMKELKEDWKNLQKISPTAGLGELERRAQAIRNPRLKQILNDYIFKYLH
ncbi:MAG: glycosyltransferase family 2 protein [Patescibacteria group bacterium]